MDKEKGKIWNNKTQPKPHLCSNIANFIVSEVDLHHLLVILQSSCQDLPSRVKVGCTPPKRFCGVFLALVPSPPSFLPCRSISVTDSSSIRTYSSAKWRLPQGELWEVNQLTAWTAWKLWRKITGLNTGQLLGYGKPASLRNIRNYNSSGWLYHTEPTRIGGQELCLLPLVLTQPAHEWNRIMQTKHLAKKVSMHLLASRMHLLVQSINVLTNRSTANSMFCFKWLEKRPLATFKAISNFHVLHKHTSIVLNGCLIHLLAQRRIHKCHSKNTQPRCSCLSDPKNLPNFCPHLPIQEGNTTKTVKMSDSVSWPI